MRTLLFVTSAIFSLIFYCFYLASNGEAIFGQVYNNLELHPISGNLLMEAILFGIIGILFIFFFTPISKQNKGLDKQILISLAIYISILIPIFLGFFKINSFIIVILFLLFLSDIFFNYISNIKSLNPKKIMLRKIGLIVNYIVTFFIIISLLIYGMSYYTILGLIFSAYFNYKIYNDYKNYISLGICFISVFIIIIFLFLKLKEIYILFI